MFKSTTPQVPPPPETADKIIADLCKTEPPLAVRESLKSMFVAAARRFAGKTLSDTEMVCDHYEALDALLEKIEIWQDNAYNS